MNRWFRHYAGMMRDEKLARTAMAAKQPIERVVWVFGAILESAAEVNKGGAYDFDVGEAAHFLHCEQADLTAIIDALTSLSRLGDGHVTRWPDRQFESDTSRDRQRRYRERLKEKSAAKSINGHDVSDVIWPSRHVTVTDQRQSTESETENRKKESKNLVPLAQNSVPREASKVPPSAAAADLEFSKEGSPEDHFWEAATTLTQRGISRGRSAQLLKLNYGDFDAALAQLRDSARAQHPPSYLGKIIKTLTDEQAPVTLAVGGPPDEPAFVREYRVEGYNIEHRRKNRWWIAGDLYDETGRVVGC